ncbi:hypothetical protein C6N75_15910 [Streptomyces solincola]|uniref:Uncharacterized protein n=1 Tax=Streptomyces solincola TaxID=2100817 RepID=A0A2S9PV02_9ACTN|nr:hypothetical protein C6N75_15910 [Streptomyces solincola]
MGSDSAGQGLRSIGGDGTGKRCGRAARADHQRRRGGVTDRFLHAVRRRNGGVAAAGQFEQTLVEVDASLVAGAANIKEGHGEP